LLFFFFPKGTVGSESELDSCDVNENMISGQGANHLVVVVSHIGQSGKRVTKGRKDFGGR
jgi:hypothetical protein